MFSKLYRFVNQQVKPKMVLLLPLLRVNSICRMTSFAQTTEHQLNDQMRAWFDNFMNHLQVDHMALETNTASREKQDFYQRMATANATDLALTSRIQSSLHFLGLVNFRLHR